MSAAANLKARTLRAFRKSNPDADLTIEWDGRVRKVQFPTGLVQYVACGTMTADGYAPTSVTATCDLDGQNFFAQTWTARQTLALVAPMFDRR